MFAIADDLPNRQTNVKGNFAYLALAPIANLANVRAMNAPNKIKSLREQRHLTLEQLSEASGLSVSFLSRLESGKRNLTVKNIVKLALQFDVTPAELLSDVSTDENLIQLQLDSSQRLPVIGEVRAGAWLEIEGESEVTEYLPISSDGRFSGQKQFALRVVGTSMDKIVTPGTYVIAVEWLSEGTNGLRDGDLVVVRRNRAMTYECTLKRARKRSGNWELWPESHDPRHQEPIYLTDGGREVEVQIIGKVIGKYEPL